jgi:hypothetical protein
MAEFKIPLHFIMAAEAQLAAFLGQQRCVGCGMRVMALTAAPIAYRGMQIGIFSHLPLLFLVALLAQLRFGLEQKALVACDMGVVAQAAIPFAHGGMDIFVCESASVMTVKTVLRGSRNGGQNQQQGE